MLIRWGGAICVLSNPENCVGFLPRQLFTEGAPLLKVLLLVLGYGRLGVEKMWRGGEGRGGKM